MVFSSNVFLFLFFPVAFIGYYLLHVKYRNIWLLLLSLIFFAWNQPRYLWIIISSIFINYTAALLYNRLRSRLVFILGILTNLAFLFYFKYFDFSISTVNNLFSSDFQSRDIALPIGISFFTFQGMSYLIDVKRNTVPVQKNPLKVALYIALFPQLIAGPIVRYSEIVSEIDNRNTTDSDLMEGFSRFIIGLSKKVIIANSMAIVVDNIWDAGIENNTIAIAWLGSICYSLQIFYDFSGYSDMAIGLGRIFGFHFGQNFNRPYISKNITEFWRRWHISLSTWFRDYVYIPLGGNRKHVYLNLFTVFLLTGLWHGSSWNFVLWGLWNAIFILIERYMQKNEIKLLNIPERIKIPLKHIYLLFIVNLGWVFFRADSIYYGLKYIGTMFGIGLSHSPGFSIGWYINRWVLFVMLISCLDICGIFSKLFDVLPDFIKKISLYALLVLSIMRVISGTYNPFIYFQF